jgi:hypothetical protein
VQQRHVYGLWLIDGVVLLTIDDYEANGCCTSVHVSAVAVKRGTQQCISKNVSDSTYICLIVTVGLFLGQEAMFGRGI